MRKSYVRALLRLVLLAGFVGAGPAQAGVVNVTFSLSGGLSTLIGALGPMGSGSATVTFTSPSFSFITIVPGPIHVNGIQFTQVINPPALGGGLQGFVALTGASLIGSLTTGGAISFAGPLHVASGTVHCLMGTAQCAGIGLPFSQVINLASVTLFPGVVGVAVVGPPAGFTVAGPAGVFLGFPLSLSLTGVEVSRQHVAEPGSLPLVLGSGLAGLGLMGARRFRR
jgi:hypothetical protein